MIQKYTTGPWFYEFLKSEDEFCNLRIVNKDGLDVCKAYVCSYEYARLMTSSPRLVKALQELIKANEIWNESVEKIIGRPTNWTDNYLDEARAAVKQAIGEGDPNA